MLRCSSSIFCLMKCSLVISDAVTIATLLSRALQIKLLDAWRCHLQYPLTQQRVTNGKNTYDCCLVQVINDAFLVHFVMWDKVTPFQTCLLVFGYELLWIRPKSPWWHTLRYLLSWIGKCNNQEGLCNNQEDQTPQWL